MPSTYLVAYGIERQFARFRAEKSFERGDQVLLRTRRGAELGIVLAPAPEVGQPDEELGQILRHASEADCRHATQLLDEARAALALAEKTASELGMAVDILDAEAAADPKRIILHVLFDDVDVRPLVSRVSTACAAFVDLLNLATPVHAGGCGSCGSGGGGCGSCGSGGGCGSGCGDPLEKTSNGEPGWVEYFSELRLKMDRRLVGEPVNLPVR